MPAADAVQSLIIRAVGVAANVLKCFANMVHVPDSLRTELRALLGAEHLVESGDALETLSKDFYWYSPVLKRQLEDKRAEVVARPGSIAELTQVVAACYRAGTPVVPRGAGTGNYGQCIPLYGGVVVDLARLATIHSVVDGVVRAEAGARLGTIETVARAAGWELRCLPSTWVKSSLGGFFCGGSGGIGSITWGGINAGDNVKSVTILTCEAEPRLVRLEERDTLKALHTYGTTGFMVEIEMRLAPKVDYDQLIFSGADWGRLLTWTDEVARNAAWPKRLVTQFQAPIPTYFKPLTKYFLAGEHVTFLLVDRAVTDHVVASATAAGLACVYRQPLSDPPKPPFITDYTWNHTTLWAMKSDPAITYLQAGFGPNFREQFAELERRFPGEILLHLEWVAGNSKMARTATSDELPAGNIVVGGIPLVRFKSEARLNEIIAACLELGVGIANPHTFYLEEGGRHPNIADKRAFKAETDPAGLLNPGKMKSYPHNPFAAPVAATPA
jgi:FAD/FMN-containing dehydrogenase